MLPPQLTGVAPAGGLQVGPRRNGDVGIEDDGTPAAAAHRLEQREHAVEVEVVEQAEAEDDVESSVPFGGEVPHVVLHEAAALQTECLGGEERPRDVGLPALDADDLRAVERELDREASLEASEVGDPHAAQIRRADDVRRELEDLSQANVGLLHGRLRPRQHSGRQFDVVRGPRSPPRDQRVALVGKRHSSAASCEGPGGAARRASAVAEKGSASGATSARRLPRRRGVRPR